VKLLALRWLKFNFVGGLGIAVQLAALAILKSVFHWHYLTATALAVEIAVLHNFLWHQRFTWKDRRGNRRETLLRLLRFHLGNGLISIVGNLALMKLFVDGLHLHYLIANAGSIALCSLANFAASEWFVFRAIQAQAGSSVVKTK
jgi:putative flippase GtrA